MGTYVLIIKISEDKNTAIYGFGPDEENLGKVEFNKLTGEYKKIDTDISIPEFYYLTAVSKILRHNKNNPHDLYPNKIIYAS
ncbi:hypothetical protein [Clostridium sp. UBA6640]|uniref:hypothetical protein n=1 Tax=Clostridium sp. UBA6640 TaxID=1946370 RepID=UPI0025C2916E|nr:hypothetical protein [Clostridium sp. UBA6640]